MATTASSLKSYAKNPSGSNQIVQNLENQLQLMSTKEDINLSLDAEVATIVESRKSVLRGSDVSTPKDKLKTFHSSSRSNVDRLGSGVGELDVKVGTSQHSKSPPDEEEGTRKFRWRVVASPTSWTKYMKKYYNKPANEFLYYDYKRGLGEIRDKDNLDILPENVSPKPRIVPKTRPPKKSITTVHQKENCPKESNCSMCGNPGHVAISCPSSMCLNCGKKTDVFIPMCETCEANRNTVCTECNQKGHIANLCPDTWRRYHATTSGELVRPPDRVNKNLMCCNCGKGGHLYEQCTEPYFSVYPPTSFLVQTRTPEYPSKQKEANLPKSMNNKNQKSIKGKRTVVNSMAQSLESGNQKQSYGHKSKGGKQIYWATGTRIIVNSNRVPGAHKETDLSKPNSGRNVNSLHYKASIVNSNQESLQPGAQKETDLSKPHRGRNVNSVHCSTSIVNSNRGSFLPGAQKETDLSKPHRDRNINSVHCSSSIVNSNRGSFLPGAQKETDLPKPHRDRNANSVHYTSSIMNSNRGSFPPGAQKEAYLSKPHSDRNVNSVHYTSSIVNSNRGSLPPGDQKQSDGHKFKGGKHINAVTGTRIIVNSNIEPAKQTNEGLQIW